MVKEIESTDYSGLGHVTTFGIGTWTPSYQTIWPESRGSSKENQCAISRRKKPCRVDKSTCLFMQASSGVQDRASKSVPRDCLGPGRLWSILGKKNKFYSVGKSKEGVVRKWGGKQRLNLAEPFKPSQKFWYNTKSKGQPLKHSQQKISMLTCFKDLPLTALLRIDQTRIRWDHCP